MKMKKIYEIIVEALWTRHLEKDSAAFMDYLYDFAWTLCDMYSKTDYKTTIEIYDFIDESLVFDVGVIEIIQNDFNELFGRVN